MESGVDLSEQLSVLPPLSLAALTFALSPASLTLTQGEKQIPPSLKDHSIPGNNSINTIHDLGDWH